MSQGLKDLVLFWNEKAAEVLNFHTNPGDDARRMAIIHIAIHDALNSTKERNRRYALGGKLDPSASAEAAVCKAAQLAVKWSIEDVKNYVDTNPFVWAGLKNQLTDNYSSVNEWAMAKQSQVDAWYSHWMPTKGEVASLLEGRKGGANGAKGWADEKSEIGELIKKQRKAGEDIGKKSFDAIYTKRSNDGRSLVKLLSMDPPDGTLAGKFSAEYYDQSGAGMNKLLVKWGELVDPFVTPSNDHFRQAGPYPLGSLEYTADYREVKQKGDINYLRSDSEEELVGSPLSSLKQHIQWNTFLAEAISQKKFDAWEAVRLLALAHAAMADGASAMFCDLYHFYHWRPITAIRYKEDWYLKSEQDSNWVPLPGVTPRVPEYPSFFGICGGIIESILVGLFPADIALGSKVVKAAHDNAIGKIYCGWNFRKSAEDGLKQGRLIGRYVLDHAFRPVVEIPHPQPVPKPTVVGDKWKRRV